MANLGANNRTTYSGSSSGVPTGTVGGAQARPAWRAADRAGRGAAAATAAGAAVCCYMVGTINTYNTWWETYIYIYIYICEAQD